MTVMLMLRMSADLIDGKKAMTERLEKCKAAGEERESASPHERNSRVAWCCSYDA